MQLYGCVFYTARNWKQLKEKGEQIENFHKNQTNFYAECI